MQRLTGAILFLGFLPLPNKMSTDDSRLDRIDTLEEVAVQCATILLHPSEKDAQKRAAQRDKAHEGLLRIITALVSLARASEDYISILETSFRSQGLLGDAQKPSSDFAAAVNAHGQLSTGGAAD